mmetsp:Transcript_29083/g.70206  ORF Transcript_29083/g.70206 Transcript_29083/m.70206 type:complete len:448 (-) Transcript_29083:68-1411(-)
MIRRLPQQFIRQYRNNNARFPSVRIRKLSTSSDGQQTVKKFQVTPAQAGLIFVGGALSARFAYNTFLLDPSSQGNGILRDGSKATVLLKSSALLQSAPNKLTIDQVDEETKNLQRVDAENFDKFCQEQRKILKEAREQSKRAAKEKLRQELEVAFENSYRRIPKFSAWYFAYSTTWKLVGEAGKSAAKHAVSFTSEKTLSEAVSHDLQALVCQKYEALILKPKLTDPKVHKAFVDSLQATHKDYLKALENLESSVATFVQEEIKEAAAAPTTRDVIVDVDWKAQLQKVDHLPLAFEKSPQFSMALIGSSVVGGKVVGAGTAVTATKALMGKLVSPFVSKAVAAATLGKGGGVAAAGAAGGAMAGGPLGAAMGAIVGVSVDMTVNAGVALMQKGSFERDVKEAMDVTIMEWEENLWPELEKTQGIWFDRADAVLGAKPTTTTGGKETS